MRHFVVATIIVVIVTVAGAVLLDSADLLPPLASAQGITIDWFTPIGPLNVSLAQPLSQVSTDKTETFQFNLGTTF